MEELIYALRGQIEEPNAMCLATVCPTTLRPAARMVLLKEIDPADSGIADSSRGFVFYTNYESRKSVELAQHPQVCALSHGYSMTEF